MSSGAESTKRRRRWIVWGAVLLAGALINVAVAWGFALRASWASEAISTGSGARTWPARVPDDWPLPTRLGVIKWPGRRGEVAFVQFVAGPGAPTPPLYWVTTARSGW